MTKRFGTKLQFEVVDSPTGVAYLHHENRVLRCKHTGMPIPRDRKYLIRLDAQNGKWRIDLISFDPKDGVVSDYVPHWETPKAAAEALAFSLDLEAKNAIF